MSENVAKDPPPVSPPRAAGEAYGHSSDSFWVLALGSIGVVFGDIGTSPLYALQTALGQFKQSGLAARDVIGVVSLIIWALLIIVTAKYVVFLMQADNKGEGGILSLKALAQRALGQSTTIAFLLGVAGSALFSGDAIITPAISVLSALEGLKQVDADLAPYILPATVVILVLLFTAQSRGTAGVAAFFGPIMVVFFLVNAALGVAHIAAAWQILQALSPAPGVSFIFAHGAMGFVVLGSVFLAVTGAEALYADMGHFGRRPIQAAWLFLVLPALICNYLGQGALILNDPKAVENPFYLMAPSWALMPLILLATAATVIASQAVITGAYSLASQAIQLGLLPRLEIVHTSSTQEGQIFIPRVNAHPSARRAGAGSAVPLVGRARQRLWHRRRRNHGDDHGARVLCRVEALALASVGRARPGLRVPVDRHRLLHRQSLQGAGWRMGSVDARRRHVHHHVDLVSRQRDPQRQDPSRTRSRWST